MHYAKKQEKQMMRKTLPLSINEFEVLNVAGQGGQAIVYVCSSKTQQSIVSVKVYDEGKEHYHSYLRQINILNNLNHPNVIKIKGFNPEARVTFPDSRIQIRPIIVLEFAYYGDLYGIIHGKQRCLPLPTSKFLLLRILQGLVYLQKSNLSHRDLKLQNILLDRDMSIKLIDFGVSCSTSSTIEEGNETKNYGTPYYRAPQTYKECYKCEKIDNFSVGILMFYIIYGRPPFEHTGYSNKEYQLVRQGKEQQFWNLLRHYLRRRGEKTQVQDQFKKLFMRLCSLDLENRPSFSQIIKNQWLNSDVASLQQAYSVLSDRFIVNLNDNKKSEKYHFIDKVLATKKIEKIHKMETQEFNLVNNIHDLNEPAQ